MKDSRESLIRAVQRYALKVQGPITLKGLERAAGVEHRLVYRCFPSGVSGLLAAAGLRDRAARLGKRDSDVLIEEMHRVARELGHVPSWAELTRLGKFSARTYYHRWGRYQFVMKAYEQWLCGRKGVAGFVEGARKEAERTEAMGRGAGRGKGAMWWEEGKVEEVGGVEPPAPRRTAAPPPAREDGERKNAARSGRRAHEAHAAEWVRGEELVGAPQGFRGLVHAPVTESGVVHLFGLLGPELGIAVEKIGTAYPDCLALREQPGSGGKWRRIAIEFELHASHFKMHRHDPARCDVIVCWENDWEGCPLEVIELKSEMRKVVERK